MGRNWYGAYPMNLSLPGTYELIGHEAIVLTRYKDSVGVWTIGIGHTKAAGPPNPETFNGEMPLGMAIDLFAKDTARYIADVNAALKVPVAQHQFDALVSFHYNTGAIKRASLTRAINSDDLTSAAKGFLLYNKPPEVVGRRTKEALLFTTGKYSNKGMATIYPATSAGRIVWSKGKRINLAETLK